MANSPGVERERFHPAFVRPGLLAILALVAGHSVARGIPLGTVGWAGVGVLSLIGLARAPARSILYPVAFCLLFASIGGVQESWLLNRDARGSAQVEAMAPGGGSPLAVIQGEVASLPRRTATGWTVLIASGATLESGGASVESASEIAVRVGGDRPFAFAAGHLVPGDEVRVAGAMLELPRSDSDGEPYEWLRSLGAVAVVQARMLEPTPRDRGPMGWFLASMGRVADRQERLILNWLPAREGAVLLAMTLGRTHRMAREQSEPFRRTGLLHIFSVSGLHTMLVGGVVMGLLRMTGARPWTKFIVMAIFLAGFASIVGLRTPVLRAALLLMAWEGRDLLRRPVEPMACLGSVGALLAILIPRSVWQVDFQMSFLCAMTIALAGPWMLALQRTLGRRLGWGWGARIVTRSAQVVCLSALIQLMLSPVLLAIWGEVSVMAPIANMILLPVLAMTTQAAFVLLALSELTGGVAAEGLRWLYYPLAASEWTAGLLAGPRLGVVEGAAWPPLFSMLLYALLFGSAFFAARRKAQPRPLIRDYAPAAMAMAALFLWLPIFQTRTRALEIYFLDVGQGDAILIVSPSGRAALVDAGPDAAAWEIPRMLRQRGVRSLDFVVATHADADHIGGMAELMDAVPVGRLYVGGSTATSPDYEELEESVRRLGLPVASVARGATIPFDEGASVTVLHPSPEFASEPGERNNASIVLMVEFAGRRVLLTGDAEAEAENSMIAAGLDLRCDVLKAGHHGAATSTGMAFLAAAQPGVAVMSCGRNNRYGHPSTNTMARLAEVGCRVLRTDADGTIRLAIDSAGGMRWNTTRRSGALAAP